MREPGSGGLDSHQHFWRYHVDEYGWISDAMAHLRRDFLPGDLRVELDRAGIDGCVAVQARQSLTETRWLLELADAHPWIEGVVGWIDLCAGDVEATLGEVRHPKLVGIRHVVQDEPDDEFLLREDFRRGVRVVLEAGLRYDVLIYPRQLPAARSFIEEFADFPLVLDHLAKPNIAEGAIAPWEDQIRTLAGLPNLHCKVSGMVTEARWAEWHHGDFRPYLDVVFEVFGEDRLMFGSDWPVCLAAARDYLETGSIVDRYTSQFSVDVRSKLFGGNARAFYGLPAPDRP